MHFDHRTLPERWRDPNGTAGDVFVVSHRGAFVDDGQVILAENAIPAFKRAADLGCDMVELDVRFTADGVPIVIHDPTLDRTSNGIGLVCDHTYRQVKGLDLVHPASRRPLSTPIPTLEEVFGAIGPRIMYNIELKTGLSALPIVTRLAQDTGVADWVTIKSNHADAKDFGAVRRALDVLPEPIDFIPCVIDSSGGLAAFQEAIAFLNPRCIECIVDYPQDPVPGYDLLYRGGMTVDGGPLFSRSARRLATRHNVRLFMNTLFVDPLKESNNQWNGGRSCEVGKIAPDSVYSFWIAHGATVIQTDEEAFVLDWLRKSGFRD